MSLNFLGFFLVIVSVIVILSLAFAIKAIARKTRRTVPSPTPQKSERKTIDETYQLKTEAGFLSCFPVYDPKTGKKLELDKTSNVPALEKLKLPIANDVSELAELMGVQASELYWLMSEDGNHYSPLPLKGAKKRRVFSPKPKLKACQKWILKMVLSKIPIHPCAEGFCKGRSVLTHAQNHTGKYFVLTMDIKKFFETITSRRVYGVFRSLGYSQESALALALLTTRQGRLPLGAPTSPAIANLICRRMDARLKALAKKFGADYSRYADDIAFSGDSEFYKVRKRFIFLVEKIIKEEGFALNKDKQRQMIAGTRQYVTGVVVNAKPSLPREKMRRLRAILHNAGKTGIEAQNRKRIPNFKEYLKGYIAYVNMFNPALYAKFKSQLEQVN